MCATRHARIPHSLQAQYLSLVELLQAGMAFYACHSACAACSSWSGPLHVVFLVCLQTHNVQPC
jgi:hypothetical protein